MRGKLGQNASGVPLIRITPADAGKTLKPLTVSKVTKDHPRRCGENYLCQQGQPAQAGSPPQMRGKLTEEDSLGDDKRITPADAGKTDCGYVKASMK